MSLSLSETKQRFPLAPVLTAKCEVPGFQQLLAFHTLCKRTPGEGAETL